MDPSPYLEGDLQLFEGACFYSHPIFDELEQSLSSAEPSGDADSSVDVIKAKVAAGESQAIFPTPPGTNPSPKSRQDSCVDLSPTLGTSASEKTPTDLPSKEIHEEFKKQIEALQRDNDALRQQLSELSTLQHEFSAGNLVFKEELKPFAKTADIEEMKARMMSEVESTIGGRLKALVDERIRVGILPTPGNVSGEMECWTPQGNTKRVNSSGGMVSQQAPKRVKTGHGVGAPSPHAVVMQQNETPIPWRQCITSSAPSSIYTPTPGLSPNLHMSSFNALSFPQPSATLPDNFLRAARAYQLHKQKLFNEHNQNPPANLLNALQDELKAVYSELGPEHRSQVLSDAIERMQQKASLKNTPVAQQKGSISNPPHSTLEDVARAVTAPAIDDQTVNFPDRFMDFLNDPIVHSDVQSSVPATSKCTAPTVQASTTAIGNENFSANNVVNSTPSTTDMRANGNHTNESTVPNQSTQQGNQPTHVKKSPNLDAYRQSLADRLVQSSEQIAIAKGMETRPLEGQMGGQQQGIPQHQPPEHQRFGEQQIHLQEAQYLQGFPPVPQSVPTPQMLPPQALTNRPMQSPHMLQPNRPMQSPGMQGMHMQSPNVQMRSPGVHMPHMHMMPHANSHMQSPSMQHPNMQHMQSPHAHPQMLPGMPHQFPMQNAEMPMQSMPMQSMPMQMIPNPDMRFSPLGGFIPHQVLQNGSYDFQGQQPYHIAYGEIEVRGQNNVLNTMQQHSMPPPPMPVQRSPARKPSKKPPANRLRTKGSQ
ncbi:hypothetical protein BDZ91DRAFT_798896 [Kalaharituber pfeilii]|nr:hypothetical protein BDZ91DRAFT_798896 [Kalaharituber pfeilii]